VRGCLGWPAVAAAASSMRISNGEAGGRAELEARRGGGPTSPASALSPPASSVERAARREGNKKKARGRAEGSMGVSDTAGMGMVPSVWR
jgi:hypothetical protein